MAIPEKQLDTWANPGSVTLSSATYATVKNSLEATDAKYAGKDFEVFLQGSYGNDTNIYAESDVDVVIRLDSIYHFNVKALTAQELAAFSANFISGNYPYADYKAHVIAALEKSFGSADVQAGEKAVKIKAKGNRRSADVVIATQFHKYYSGAWPLRYEPGICFFTSGGAQIVNYPKQHSVNCTTKHQGTNEWFKPMVRILKNMRSKLVEDGAIADGSAPSYFIEGLLYNVPDDKFGKSYGDTFVAALTWIVQADRSKLVCANKQYCLTFDSAAECWPRADCDGFINAVVELWNNWT
jgi:hypothetical protein